MYYSYYFDVEKTHLINFGFVAMTTTEEPNGDINAQFNVYIRELKNNEVIMEEQKNVQFLFPANKRTDTESDYDVDFLRERIASSQKFIFKVINNRDTTQNVVIGLLTEAALKNPLGCEILYENEPYKAELKAGNLSRLETSYTEPVIRKTVANYNFNEGGVPEELQLPDGGEYVNGYRLYRTSRLSTVFKEPIQTKNRFVFEANIAPETFDVAVEPTIYEVTLAGVGTFALNKTTAHFTPEGGTASNRVSVPLIQALSAEQFFNSGLRASSLLKVEGDGNGNLKVSYANVLLISVYNKQKSFTGISIEGKIRKESAARIKLKLDNIVAYYEK